MKIEELLSKTLNEVLENYSVLYSPECDYVYGIADDETIEKTFSDYDLEDQASMDVEPLIRFDEIGDFDSPLLTEQKIREIMCNLGMPKLKKEEMDLTVEDGLLECRTFD